MFEFLHEHVKGALKCAALLCDEISTEIWSLYRIFKAAPPLKKKEIAIKSSVYITAFQLS